MELQHHLVHNQRPRQLKYNTKHTFKSNWLICILHYYCYYRFGYGRYRHEIVSISLLLAAKRTRMCVLLNSVFGFVYNDDKKNSILLLFITLRYGLNGGGHSQQLRRDQRVGFVAETEVSAQTLHQPTNAMFILGLDLVYSMFVRLMVLWI